MGGTWDLSVLSIQFCCEPKTALENGVYSFIGSDAHRDESRSTDMTEAFDLIDSIDKKYKDDFKKNSNLLVEDGEIEFSGKFIKERKKLLGIW